MFVLFALVLKPILTQIKLHFAALYDQCDPLEQLKESITFQENENPPKASSSWQFAFSLFVLLYTELYGTFGFHYEATGSWDIGEILAGPYYFVHQIFPRQIWLLSDIGFAIDWVAAGFVFATIITNSRVQNRCVMSTDGKRVWIGSKALEPEESYRILAFRRKVKPYLLALVALLNVLFSTYFLIYVVVINALAEFNIQTFIFWALYPLFMFYIFYCKFFLNS